MSDDPPLKKSIDHRVRAERALRALAATAEARHRLSAGSAAARADRLRRTQPWADLQQEIAALARGERAAGRSPEQLLVLLKTLLDSAGLNRTILRAIEPDIMRWGIDAFYAG